MRQAKFVALAVVALLTLIVVLQNTDPVVVKVLFFSVTAPAALLFFVSALVGFLIGMSASYLLMKRPLRESAKG
jgi:uncharacterized integral membrane protein